MQFSKHAQLLLLLLLHYCDYTIKTNTDVNFMQKYTSKLNLKIVLFYNIYIYIYFESRYYSKYTYISKISM